MSNAAIYFHPEGYDTTGSRLMGRHSAGESFIRGFLRHADVDRFYFWKVGGGSVEELEAMIQRIEPLRRPITWIPARDRRGLGAPGVIYMPGPGISSESWLRRPLGSAIYGISAITHTTATQRVMDGLADMLTCPVEPWDALICTSHAVRQSIETQLEMVREDLRQRLGATRFAGPELVTIPLGINAADYAPSPQHRAAWRERLAIAEDEVVAFYMGRLAVGGKMNPAMMAAALQTAAQRTGRKICWIVAGWAESEAGTKRFHELTRSLCPDVRYIPVDGRPPDVRFSIWSAADFFISLSDNIQETFGLTPVEAMAAGLPAIVSDWDGYRDTVRHGVDGFRARTYAPRPGLGRDLAYQFGADWLGYEQ
ncbi:MAG TPA: glycosyltransferase family 4 protein, partial [Phenylobacterium sp.]